MRRLVSLALLTVSFAGSALAQQTPAVPSPYADFDGYAVISTLLKHTLDQQYSRTSQPNKFDFPNPIVVELRTSKGFMEQNDPRKCFSDQAVLKDWSGAFQNYVDLNKKDWALQKQLQIEDSYEIVAARAFFTEGVYDGWHNFYNAYPHSVGFFEFSVVGLDPDKKHAVVYMGWSCGGLCGEGLFHLFERQGNSWVERRPKSGGCMWVS